MNDYLVITTERFGFCVVKLDALGKGVIELDTTPNTLATETPLVHSPPQPLEPIQLEEGIVFLSNRDDSENRAVGTGLGPYNLYVMAPDGSNQITITSDLSLSNMSSPAVSPDGTKVAVGNYGSDITIYDLSGQSQGNYKIQSDVSGIWVNDWSSDGNRLLVSVFGQYSPEREFNEEIYVLDLSSGSWSRLTDDGYRNLFASWSPDGNQIAYMEDYTLWIMDSDGKNKKQIHRDEARDLDWSPDGKSIVIESLETPHSSTNYDLWLVKPDGTG